MTYDITSTSNNRIKWLIGLRDRRHRDEEGLFVVEGERLFRRATGSGLVPTITFVADEREMSGETFRVAPEVLDRASYRSSSQGLIAVFPQFDVSLERIAVGDVPLLLIAENIEKPGNLGAMMRTAEAAGVDAVIAVGGSPDPFNPNVMRSSTGAVFSLPVAVTGWDGLERWIGGREVDVVATVPGASASLWETDLSRPVAVLIGAEDLGLSERALSVATERVSIPQAKGTTDSLNASVAAAVVLFETVRQRSQYQRTRRSRS